MGMYEWSAVELSEPRLLELAREGNPVESCRMGSRLGLMRAALIVWASGTVASAVLALLVSPTGWAFIAGSARQIDGRWGYAVTFVLLDALLAAVGVTIAVWLLAIG
jgi:hypothetical protein